MLYSLETIRFGKFLVNCFNMIVVAIVMVIVVMIMLLVVMVSLEARCDPEQSAPTLDPACHLAAPSHIEGVGGYKLSLSTPLSLPRRPQNIHSLTIPLFFRYVESHDLGVTICL